MVKEEAQVLPLFMVYFTSKDRATPTLVAELARKRSKAEAAAARAPLGRVPSDRPPPPTATLHHPVARAKRCVVQVGIWERDSGQLVDCGSGAALRPRRGRRVA